VNQVCNERIWVTNCLYTQGTIVYIIWVATTPFLYYLASSYIEGHKPNSVNKTKQKEHKNNPKILQSSPAQTRFKKQLVHNLPTPVKSRESTYESKTKLQKKKH